MSRVFRGFLGIFVGFGISAVSFGILISVGFSAIRSGTVFTPDNPIVAALRLVFYLGLVVMFGSPLHFWFIQPAKDELQKIWKKLR